jgi:hypothetical protein
VPKIGLQRARVVTGIGKRITTRMPQHVRMDREGHPGALPDPMDQRVEALGRHRPAALGREHVRGWRLLTLQTPQRPQLVALQRMHARRPRLDAPHVQPASRKLDLVPLQITQLERPQSVPERITLADPYGLSGPVGSRALNRLRAEAFATLPLASMPVR